MQSLIETIFWIALGLTLYVAVGYPYLLYFLARLRRRFHVRDTALLHAGAELPAVSVLLPAWNDDRRILDRLQNLLETDYPADRLEIVVGADVRDDLIGDLVATVNDGRVRVVRSPAPDGKTSLINACLSTARHDVIVLTDCEVRFDRQTMRRLARHFYSPHVGGVIGRLLTADSIDNERQPAGVLESTADYEASFGVAPASGHTVAAYQRELLGWLPAGVTNAGQLAGLRVYASGLHVVFDADAVAQRRSAIASPGAKWRNPLGRALHHLRDRWALLRAAGYSRALLVLLSHWLKQRAPLFVVTAMMGNAILAGDPLYLRLLLLHETAYLMLLIYLCLKSADRWPAARSPLKFNVE